MFPNPEKFEGLSGVIIDAVAAVAKFYSTDHRFTRRWRSRFSPGIRSVAWTWRVEDVRHLIGQIERRIDLTELSSCGIDDGLPSRQSSRLCGLRDVAHQTANTIRRHIACNRNVSNRRFWWDLTEQLETAVTEIEAMVYGGVLI